jgi:phytoene synthase
MTPDQYCEARAAQSGSSFYYSFRLLPAHKRRAITALYAFCREVDDVVDEVHDAGVARTKLAWWRDEVARIGAGGVQHPVAQALVPVVREFALPLESLDEIVDGMAMDLAVTRYDDFDALYVYCHKVAGVVGSLSATIFGYDEAATAGYGHDLGIAFQLTNIVRDVGEDARRGRIYLPQEDLARFGVTPASVLRAQHGEGFAELMAFETTRAKAWYERALAQLAPKDRKRQRAGLAMAAIYRTLLDEIARDGYHVLDRRIALTPLRKLWIAWRTH